MPKISKGIPYFDLDTDLNNDMRVKLLRAEFGIKGFGVWIQLLIQIYSDEGYYMKWDNDTKLLFASDVGESGGLVDEVVKRSVKRGLFNEPVFDQFSVLTSKHIQDKYFNAIKRRTTETEVDARYLVIDADSDIINGNDCIKLLNVHKKEQSRVEESKVDQSKEDDTCYTFGEFWNDYDKKKERKKCERKWKKVSEPKRYLIKEFIPVYKKHQPDPEYRKYPSTFLNSEIWNDDWSAYPPKQEQNHKNNGNNRKSKGDKHAERLKRILS